MEKTGYFEESPGVKSSNRLMSFLALITALIIALASVFMKSITLGDALPMLITLLAYSAGQKVFSKVIEIAPKTKIGK